MGAEATCVRLDVTSNGIGRRTPSSALLGRLQLSEGACTVSLLDVPPTLFQCSRELISREGGEASAETSEATCEIIVVSASNLQVSAGNYDFPPCDPS